MPVARHLLRPTLELERAALKRSSIRSCTGWGLHSFSGHPKNWCALTAPFHPYPEDISPFQGRRSKAVYFLLHFPSRRRDSTLWSTLPCGVRTFLRTMNWPSDRLDDSNRYVLMVFFLRYLPLVINYIGRRSSLINADKKIFLIKKICVHQRPKKKFLYY
jgi:hypothetical protein